MNLCDNCTLWFSSRENMAVITISWLISKNVFMSGLGSVSQPLDWSLTTNLPWYQLRYRARWICMHVCMHTQVQTEDGGMNLNVCICVLATMRWCDLACEDGCIDARCINGQADSLINGSVDECMDWFMHACMLWYVYAFTCIYCIKNMHFHKACILFQWNIERYTGKLYRKINLWKFTKSKRFHCFTCFDEW